MDKHTNNSFRDRFVNEPIEVGKEEIQSVYGICGVM